MRNAPPEVGSWYETADGTKIEVVAFDEDDETVEVQHFDGTLEEFDLDTWRSLTLFPADPPEDWSGSLDLHGDDYGVDLDHPAGEMRFGSLDDYNFED